MSFNISLAGNENTKFYARDGLFVAKGYERIVIGKRGAYLEFSPDQIDESNIYIPDSEAYRINNDKVYYVEYRTKINDVMVYFQKQTVKYANYKIGFYYIAPKDLYLSWGKEAKRVLKQIIQFPITIFLKER